MMVSNLMMLLVIYTSIFSVHRTDGITRGLGIVPLFGVFIFKFFFFCQIPNRSLSLSLSRLSSLSGNNKLYDVRD